MNVGNAAAQSAYNIGNAQANNATNIGNARASSYAGTANAINNAVGQISGFVTNAPMNNAMMAYYRNNTPSTTGRTSTALPPSMVMQGFNPIFGQDPLVARTNYMINT
jgi:hypothetical protein